ncbi:helix-turn-helix domain-containing protein [Nonomuraea sp. JJY05]
MRPTSSYELRARSPIDRARRMHASGRHTAAEIARALGVSRATLYRHLSA